MLRRIFCPTLCRIALITAVLTFYSTTRAAKESISDYADQYRTQWATLLAHDKVLPEEDVVAAFVNGLREEFKLLQDCSTFGLGESKLLDSGFEA